MIPVYDYCIIGTQPRLELRAPKEAAQHQDKGSLSHRGHLTHTSKGLQEEEDQGEGVPAM